MYIPKKTVYKRLLFVLTAGVVLFLIFCSRLFYIQVFSHHTLSSRALNSWSREIPYEAERGRILDRNRQVLANNVSRPSIFIVPKQVKNPDKTAAQLSNVLGMKTSELKKDLTKNESIVRLSPEGRKMSNEKAAEVKELGLDGVYVAEDFKRNYPHGSYLAHVLGFAGIDNQGLMGLEAYYNDLLKGKNGHVSFYSDAKGRRMSSLEDHYTPPVNGLDLELTIDEKVQTIIERELDLADKKYHPDSAIAIAMDPTNGEILGMSSRPNFNPEDYQSVSPDIYNRNLPIWRTYEPGSTFKVITLAAALQEKLVDLKHDTFHDPGYITVAGTDLHCWKRGGHGSETFMEVVQNSCNPGFVVLGQRLGKQRLFSYIRDFGFGEKTGIDLQGEGSGILFKPSRVGPLELATTAFGQGVSVTPIQQIAAVAATINGGYLYVPHIAKAWMDPISKEPIFNYPPVMKRKVISEETSKKVRNALENVVSQGTGRNAYVDGYRVGGKTGTAQKVENGHYLDNNYILSFMGFAPANDPKIIVYVAIDHPKDTVQFGGTVAAPLAGQIIHDSLQAMGVKEQKGGKEKKRTWPEQAPVIVPNLTGMKKGELANALYDLKIKTAGSGEYVEMQSPKAGVKLPVGSTVMIYLGDKKP